MPARWKEVGVEWGERQVRLMGCWRSSSRSRERARGMKIDREEAQRVPGLAMIGDAVVVARQGTKVVPVVNRVRTSSAKRSNGEKRGLEATQEASKASRQSRMPACRLS